MSINALVTLRMASRFDVAREEAATRASLQECGDVLETGSNALERARSLVNAAISATPDGRREATRQAALSLRAAIGELQAVQQELGA